VGVDFAAEDSQAERGSARALPSGVFGLLQIKEEHRLEKGQSFDHKSFKYKCMDIQL